VAGVKCPKCGVENSQNKGDCKSCGATMTPPIGEDSGGKHMPSGAQKDKTVNHKDVARKWRFDYAVTARDETIKGLDAVCGILSELEESAHTVQSFLDFCANQIARQFGIREVSIGLKSKADSLFRYRSIVGSNEVAEKALRSIAYNENDFRLNGSYRGTSLSKYSTLFLAEDNPYTNGEEVTYSHPVLLRSERRTATECIEGDYIDVYIFGQKGDLIGWIELSGTRAGNLPDVRTIRWIEAVSRIISFALSRVDFPGGRGN
jgi:hypothetical protein